MILKKTQKIKKFNQIVWLKSYVNMNKKQHFFEKIFLKLMNNLVGKATQNVRKHRNIKLSTTRTEETIWCLNLINISFSQKINIYIHVDINKCIHE